MLTSPPPFPLPASASNEPRLASVHRMADAVCAALGVASAFRRCGRAVDLAGLDADMGRLCAYALDLPPEQGRSFRPRLIAIRAELDALTAAITPSDESPDP